MGPDDPGRYRSHLTPRDRARAAETDRERAESLERGDEPTGSHDISPEMRELASLRRRMSEVEGLRATDLRLLHELRERAADRVSGAPAPKNHLMLKSVAASVLLVVTSTVGTITWFEDRAEKIAVAAYDEPVRAGARQKAINDALDIRLLMVASRVDVAVQQAQLTGIVERLERMEQKIDRSIGTDRRRSDR